MLQIGDIHYDKFSEKTLAVDNKDKTPPAGIVQNLARPVSLVIGEHLKSRMSAGDRPAVVICGDLTSRGDTETYKRAVAYLEQLLCAIPATCPNADQVHIVPGNHDVDWRKTMPYADLSVHRLRPIVDIVDSSLIPAPLTVTTRTSNIQSGNAAATISSVNTCRASGAYRQRPEFRIADPIIQALAEASGLDESELRSKVATALADSPPESHEGLDIPLIEAGDLQYLVTTIGQPPPSGLHIVAAHHGFLPQVTARINPYSEMVNGGDVRQALLASGRPVVYLHGHIHEDRVEVITAGSTMKQVPARPQVVIISAPEFADGYNELEFEFSERGTALGLIIKRYRIAGGVIYRAADERIALGGRSIVDPRAKYFIQKLHGTMARGLDIIRWRSDASAPEDARQLDDDLLEECIEELCWQGVIDCDSDRTLPFAEREYRFK
ncbi:metallophosphoesterase [Mycolicibacterium obuense]|uniref:metallophosphoesterase n=1 Tax=Mycolicibacterium obuense TaxID=1807 RepID=UPI0012FEFF8A|nr:metallophosphoesterase [Mycolicibacterium obuense]